MTRRDAISSVSFFVPCFKGKHIFYSSPNRFSKEICYYRRHLAHSKEGGINSFLQKIRDMQSKSAAADDEIDFSCSLFFRHKFLAVAALDRRPREKERFIFVRNRENLCALFFPPPPSACIHTAAIFLSNQLVQR